MDACALTRAETTELSKYEKTIERGLATFCEVGAALMAIRDSRLYRVGFASFPAYCKERWGFSKSHAYRLIESAQIGKQVSPVGDAPIAERHTRPLAALPVESRKGAWERAKETAPLDDDGEPQITASHVENIVEQVRAENAAFAAEPDIITLAADCRMVATIEELAGEKFGTIYADPPWQYGNQATRAATDNHYDTMTVDELCAIPVSDYAADDAHLHLWTTNGFLPDAFRVLTAWGFEYRSCYVWVKPQLGIGNYWRVSHEFLLLGIRGNAKRFLNHSQPSWGQFDRTKHSEKPDEIRRLLEYVSPAPHLELFGRRLTPGWTVMGNQVVKQLFA